MSLMKRIKVKRKIAKAVDEYLQQLLASKDSTGVKMSLNGDDFVFEEMKSDRSVRFQISQKSLYDVCDDLDDEVKVQDRIDKYLSKLYFEEYVAQRSKKE